MFGFLLRLALAMLAAFLAGRYILGEAGAVALIASAMSGFAIASLSSLNLMMHGHGVDGSRHAISMPMLIFTAYALVLCIILIVMLVSVFSIRPAAGADLRVFGLGLFFAWIGGIIDWYASSSKKTHYFSERAERARLASGGFDQKGIDALIDDMRFRGRLPPKAGKK